MERYYHSALRTKDPKKAINLWEKIVTESHSGEYFYYAQLELAKYDFALRRFERVEKRLGGIDQGKIPKELRGEVLFWLGLAQLEISKKKGIKTLRHLIELAPNSRWAARARVIIGFSYHSIQTGAFKTKSYAVRQKQTLERLGFTASVVEKKIGDDIFYRVRVGGFKDLETGVKLIKRLKELGFKEARMVTH